jgi:hypothetical protein
MVPNYRSIKLFQDVAKDYLAARGEVLIAVVLKFSLESKLYASIRLNKITHMQVMGQLPLMNIHSGSTATLQKLCRESLSSNFISLN